MRKKMKCTCGQNKDICIDCMQDYISKLEDMLFVLVAMEKPPGFVCGYNGQGYFNPVKHPYDYIRIDRDGMKSLVYI